MTAKADSNLAAAAQLHLADIPVLEEKIKALMARRDVRVAKAYAEGKSRIEIAEALGVTVSYIQVMVQRANGTLPPSRRNGVKPT